MVAWVSYVIAGCAAQPPVEPAPEPASEPAVVDPQTQSQSQALGDRVACTTVCDCPLGMNVCTSAGVCVTSGFSPPPPWPLCGATCQCPVAQGCGNLGKCTTATLTASQNPVIVPAGATTAQWTLSWNAPGFAQIDVWGRQNLQWPGQILLLGTASSSGSAPEPMSVGEIATLWLYAHGDTTTPLAILNISGQH